MRRLMPVLRSRARRLPLALLAILALAAGAATALSWQAGAPDAVPAAAAAAYRPLTIPQAPPHVVLAAARKAAAAAAPGYLTVSSGQTLAGIAASQCGTAADWTGIYAASRAAHLTAWNANDLAVGQHLLVQCYSDPGMAGRAPLPPPPPPAPAAVSTASTSYAGNSSGSQGASTDTYSAAPVQAAPVQATAVSTAGDGSFQSCVIAAESGGNASAVNPESGAGGLYQFLPSTWQSLGYSGLPEDAPVAEQNAAFQQEYAAAGTSPWAPSDGC